MCMVLNLVRPDPDFGGREGWSWRPGGFGWLGTPWTQVDRSGQSPECPPLSAGPLSPPQLPLPRANPKTLCRFEANLWISNIVCLAVEANLCQPKTDLRILHLAIVATTQLLKDSNLLAWLEVFEFTPRFAVLFLLSTKQNLPKRLVLGPQLWFHSVFLGIRGQLVDPRSTFLGWIAGICLLSRPCNYFIIASFLP